MDHSQNWPALAPLLPVTLSGRKMNIAHRAPDSRSPQPAARRRCTLVVRKTYARCLPRERDHSGRTAKSIQNSSAFLPASGHFGLHPTHCMLSTICSATATSTVSAPRAASVRHDATCCQVSFSRLSAGRCFSTSSRTSASVLSVITPWMTSGRGSARDQSGRAGGMSAKQPAAWAPRR
jgi:hypothetical protein